MRDELLDFWPGTTNSSALKRRSQAVSAVLKLVSWIDSGSADASSHRRRVDCDKPGPRR